MPPAPALVALGHATSGCIGTAISTAALAPLDLVTTRLKAQRHLNTNPSHNETESDSSESVHYDGILDAFRAIVTNEGGVSALYAGLGPDVAKSIIDSFLFFGFYNYFLRRRRRRRPGIAQELATGALAGICARGVTTPLSNAITRRQVLRRRQGDSSSDSSSSDSSSSNESLWATCKSIVREGGVRGLWSGYSATVVLSLNPGITFLINRRLAERIIPALEEEWEDVPIAWVAFSLAATSKAAAVALTYPFQMAKMRLQMPRSSSLNGAVDGEKREWQSERQRSHFLRVWDLTIFSVVHRIMRSEGLSPLYDGLRGELLKSFFAHGLTMLTKGLIHRWVIRVWYILVPLLRKIKTRSSSRLASKSK